MTKWYLTASKLINGDFINFDAVFYDIRPSKLELSPLSRSSTGEPGRVEKLKNRITFIFTLIKSQNL